MKSKCEVCKDNDAKHVVIVGYDKQGSSVNGIITLKMCDDCKSKWDAGELNLNVIPKAS
jgi:hypothetical protein